MTLAPFMDVRDFGAIHAADDTATLAAAITAANAADEMLFLPGGVIKVQPGALPEIKSSWWGPQATIRAVSNANAPLLTVNMPAHSRFTLRSIEGVSGGVGIYAGYGLLVKGAADSLFDIMSINYFGIGLWLNGGGNPTSHISTNDFHIINLFECHRGMQLSSGQDDNYQTEANRFSVNYAHHFTQACVRIGDSPFPTTSDENVFDFGTIEVLIPNAHAFDMSAQAQRNKIYVRGLMGGVSGTGYFVNSDPAAANTYDLCRLNGIPYRFSQRDAVFMGPNLTDGFSRKEMYGTSAPTTGAWMSGDMVRNVNTYAGGPLAWACTVSGSPGTWVGLP